MTHGFTFVVSSFRLGFWVFFVYICFAIKTYGQGEGKATLLIVIQVCFTEHQLRSDWMRCVFVK